MKNNKKIKPKLKNIKKTNKIHTIIPFFDSFYCRENHTYILSLIFITYRTICKLFILSHPGRDKSKCSDIQDILVIILKEFNII